MRKVHYKVTLDILVHEDDNANDTDRLMNSGFIIDPYEDALDEVCEIHDITVESVEITYSR